MSQCPFCPGASTLRGTLNARIGGESKAFGIILDTNPRLHCYELDLTGNVPVAHQVKQVYPDHTHTCREWPNDVERGWTRTTTPDDAEITRCRYCNQRVIWATNPKTGKSIPLCARTPVFAFDPVAKSVRELPSHYVSHWATCPNADAIKAERQFAGRPA